MHSRNLMKTGVGVVALSLALGACGQKPAPAAEAPQGEATQAARATEGSEQSMRVTRIERRSLSEEIVATGRLVVREEAAVGSELSGFRVAEVYVDEGDQVEKGARLARLDGALLQAQIAQAEATMATQAATAEFKESQLARAESLGEAGAMSAEMIEMRRMEAAQARAAVNASEAAVNEMRVRQSRMTLRAPVAGVILERNLRPGEIATAGSMAPYFRIAREGLVELDAELPDTQLAHLEVGEKAFVSLPTGEVFEGEIRFLSPRVDERTGLGSARIELPYDEALRAGSFAEARFAGNQDEILTVLAGAVRYEAGGPVLMRVDENNVLQRAPVKLGERIGEYVQVVEGPPAGTRVLATGAAFQLEGDVIQPVENDEARGVANVGQAGQQ